MKHDELFRQALQRQNDRAAGMKMPRDMEQRVMQRIEPKSTPRHWLYAASIGAIAASILLLLALHYKGWDIEKNAAPVTVGQAEQTNGMAKDESIPAAKPAEQQAWPDANVKQPVSAVHRHVIVKNTQAKHDSATNHPSTFNAKSGYVAATDQLTEYIARLEAEMKAVDDSVRAAHLEKLIAADARLQQLVNSIVNDETDRASRELMKDSTANYINF